MKKIPKTQFEIVDIDREANITANFLENDRWSSVFQSRYPELKEIKDECNSVDDCIAKCKIFLESVHSKNEVAIFSAREQIRSEWGKIGPEFLSTLSEHFETDWLEGREITGYISVLPVFPRFLDDQSFFTGYKDLANNIEISAHEIVHFLWFKKWKEVFPDAKKEEFGGSHLVWRLSEIIDPIILQCHPRIKELIKPKKWGYKSFDDIKIGDVSMIEYFKNVYLKSVGASDTFEVTIRKLWAEANLHAEEIGKF